MAQTGENDQALRKILDMTRFISIALLAMHFYFYCYSAFQIWHLTHSLSDRLLENIARTGLFDQFIRSKLIALAFLAISLLGTKGKKDDKQNFKSAFSYIVCGLVVYFTSFLALRVEMGIVIVAALYIGITSLGFILILTGGTLLSRIIKSKFNNNDIFNAEGETFPQQEQLITNEFSVNLPMKYQFKGKEKRGWLNVIAPFRATMVTGSAGAGKTSHVIRFFISQALAKPDPFCMMVYDFKFPDLSLIAYNHWLINKDRYKAKSDCYFINFDDLSRTHRGNPLDPLVMTDITDASESARTILLGLNTQWQKKQGDFFIESPINFLTACIWFLRKYRDGMYCTLPHVIEFMQLDYDTLFTMFRTEAAAECSTLINPFLNAYLADVMEQLEGQIASAKIALSRLASPQLYYVLSGNDFSLDINNPDHPKLLCMGNNPMKIQIYGAVLSLYVNRMLKVINQKNKVKCMLIFDEFPTITTDIIATISTGRSNLLGVLLGVQSFNQLRKEYGKESADVITSIAGNLIAGQETGESAKQVSDQIGKIMQERESLSISEGGVSVSKSKQLDYAVTPSKIAKLSSGQFVGILSDTPQQPIELKAFDCQIIADFDAINKEEATYKPIPVIRQVDQGMVDRNFLSIKQDIADIARSEIERMLLDPALAHLVIKK